tara:strand:- start:13 stop:432 length:420 start_codon:yes stop_codon:yes gene_type:complete
MKKLLVIVVLGLLLSHCSVGESGKMIPGFEESPMWRVFASDEDKKAFYEKRITEYQEMQVHIICIEWDKNWDRSNERELISEALIRKNENPMICRNPSQDSISRAKRETQNAEADAARERLKAQRARNAQRKAEQESEW